MNRKYAITATLMAISSCAFAQLTWDTTPGIVGVGNGTVETAAGTWDVATTGNWTSDAGVNNVAWTNGSNAIFGDAGAAYTVSVATSGVAVTDLTYSGPSKLTFAADSATATDNAMIALAGDAAWDTGGGEIEFKSNQTLDVGLDLAGNTLTVSGGGTFDAGERGNGVNWTAGNLVFTEATILRGAEYNIGPLTSVTMAGGSTFVMERNANQNINNDWVLNGDVAFTNRFNRISWLNGEFSGTGRAIFQNGGNWASFFRLNNTGNTFSGGVTVDSSATDTRLVVAGGLAAFGTAPGSFDADYITLISNGLLQINTATAFDANQGFTLDDGGLLAINNAVAINGEITGDGGLQVSYNGGVGNNQNLTLNAASTYTGETWIYKGNVILGATNALGQGVVKLGGDQGGTAARLYLNGQSQTIGGLYNFGNQTKQVVNLNAATTGSTAGTLIFDVADGESYAAGSATGVNAADDRGNFNVIKNGLGSQELGNLQIAGDATVNAGTLIVGNNNGTSTMGNASVTGGTLRIDEVVTATSYATSGTGILQIGDSATGAAGSIGSVNVANDGTVLFDLPSALTYSGIISGTGGLQLDGGNDLTLTGANTFTGPVEIIDGTLIAGNASALADYSLVDVSAGEIFRIPYDGINWTSAQVADTGGLSTTVNWLDPSAYLGLDISAGSISLDHNASGAHGLWIQGGNELTINSPQSYTGTTRIFSGTVKLTANDQLPSGSLLSIGGSGTSAFDLAGFNQTIAGLNTFEANTRFIDNTGGTASTLTIDVPASNGYTYGANIFETGGIINIVKNGAGSQNFTKNGLSSYTGSATVNAGRLGFRFPAAIDPATQAITVASGAAFMVEGGNGTEWQMADIDDLFANATFNAGSSLAVQSWVEAFDYTSDITGDIGLIKTGDATLTLSGTNTYTGKTIVEGSLVVIDDEADLGVNPAAPAADHITLDGGGLQAAAALTVDDANRGITLLDGGGTLDNNELVMTVAAPIVGTGSLTVTSVSGNTPGLVELTGTNTYSGETIINQTSLKVSSTDNLPDTSNLRINGVGILLLNGDLDGGNAADFTRPLGTAAGEVQFTNGGGFAAAGADRRIDIGGAGADLEWGVDGFMPATTPSAYSFFLSGVEATHTTTLVNGMILPGSANYSVLTADSAAALDAVMEGVISGTGGLRVRGAGTIALEGDNTYDGVTNIENSGTLLVNGDQSAATGAVTVSDTATLGGTGTVGGAVTVQSGGTITAGASAGTLTVPSLTLNDGAEAIVEIDAWNSGVVVAGTDSDLVVVTGALTVDPGTITIVIPSTPGDFTEDNASFDIVTFGSETGLGGATINVDDSAWSGAGTWSVTADLDSVILEYTAGSADPYDAWSSGGAFDADSNGDGVDNGLAWMLGAADENTDALSLLPTHVESSGDLVMTFTIVDPIAPHQLFVEHSNDLAGGWTSVEVPATSSTVSDLVFVIVDNTGTLSVTVTVPASKASVDGSLFGRLSAIEN